MSQATFVISYMDNEPETIFVAEKFIELELEMACHSCQMMQKQNGVYRLCRNGIQCHIRRRLCLGSWPLRLFFAGSCAGLWGPAPPGLGRRTRCFSSLCSLLRSALGNR